MITRPESHPLRWLAPLVFSSIAGAFVLNPTDINSGVDNGPKDGVFDAFVNPGAPSLVDNGFTEFRFAAEFDLTALGPITSATLMFGSAGASSTVDIYGYTGDGAVSLTDIGITSGLLFDDLFLPNLNTVTSVDVTAFVSAQAGGFAGFSWDEESMRFITNTYAPVQLSIEPVSTVPEASSWLMLAAGLALLQGVRRRFL